MRLGGPVFDTNLTPERWIGALRAAGYSAAFCPLSADADDTAITAYTKAASRADIVIAEVGAWSNPISPDDDIRREAIAHCQRQLDLADRIGANCCVNIAGSRSAVWDGPHPDNLSEATFDLVVETVRQIIDTVAPRRTYYTLEMMPWIYPDSPGNYVRLIEAIDRERFAVHLDPVNLVSSPQRFFRNAALIRECFSQLGPKIRSCHAKDIALSTELTVHLDETRPGTGGLSYSTFLLELAKLGPDMPLMLEHLPNESEYALARQHVRSVAKEVGVAIV